MFASLPGWTGWSDSWTGQGVVWMNMRLQQYVDFHDTPQEQGALAATFRSRGRLLTTGSGKQNKSLWHLLTVVERAASMSRLFSGPVPSFSAIPGSIGRRQSAFGSTHFFRLGCTRFPLTEILILGD